MQPKQRRVRLQSAALARGRMFLKSELGWVPGFPLCVQEGKVLWFPAPRSGPWEFGREALGREHLHRATYTWSKLVHRFPRALPKLVDNLERWKAGVPQLLELLKGAIHYGASLPASLLAEEGVFSHSVRQRAVAMGRERPALQPVLDAFSWTLFLHPDELPQALDWLESYAKPIEAILALFREHQPVEGVEGLSVVLSLRELARRHQARRVDELLRALADPLHYTCVTHADRAYLDALRRAAKQDPEEISIPPRPSPILGQRWVGFLQWLWRQSRKSRRRALDLLQALSPFGALQGWRSWWQAMEVPERHLRQLADPYLPRRKALDKAEQLREELEALEQQFPASQHIPDLLADCKTLAQQDHSELYERLFPLLCKLPTWHENCLARAALLRHCLQYYTWHKGEVLGFVDELLRFLSRHDDGEGVLLRSWSALWQGWTRPHLNAVWRPTSAFVNYGEHREKWAESLDAIALCDDAYGGIDSPTTERLVEFTYITGDAQTAVAYFPESELLQETGAYVEDDLLACAHQLAVDPVSFGELLRILAPLEDEDVQDYFAPLCKLDASLERDGWGGLIRERILAGHGKELIQLSQTLQVLEALRLAIPAPHKRPLEQEQQELPSWAAHYPACFYQDIMAIHAMTPRAEHVVQRVLGHTYPTPQARRQEIAALERQLAQGAERSSRLEQRLERLRQWLEQPPIIKASRVEKLQGKLKHAIPRVLLESWAQKLQETLRRELARKLGLPSVPGWLLDGKHANLLSAIFALSTGSQKLAFALLRRRSQAPPWTLDDEPANQQFLERLRAQGINPTPWCSPPKAWEVKAEGQTFVLNFEEDPLEIFTMGQHFSTCLRPGAFNFFSVFANAADINKHVLYARNQKGQVVGRCLLALTDQGGILTFCPYCHDERLDFAAEVARIATKLATEMGALTLTQGKVSCLVSSEWYDDGPRDLCETFPCLQEDSPLQKELETVSPEALLECLKAAFFPIPLHGLVLGQVVQLPVIQKRPQLILPLIPLLMEEVFSTTTWCTIASLAKEAGALHHAHTIAKKHLFPYMLRQKRDRGELWDRDTAWLINKVDPSLGLRLMKQTRDKGVRSDEEESVPWRRELLAWAHEALGRRVKAQTLRQNSMSRKARKRHA